MATVIRQHFYSFGDGFTVGIHKIKLTAASDTLTVPKLSDSASGVSCKQLERSWDDTGAPGDATVTVTNSDAFTVAIAGTIDDEVYIATIHNGEGNTIDEE